MAKPKKGVTPPQLKKYLKKKTAGATTKKKSLPPWMKTK
jgi:hypothetical protein